MYITIETGHAYKFWSRVDNGLGGNSQQNKMTESSELLATYAGLGTHDGEEYFRGDECLGKCRVQQLQKKKLSQNMSKKF